MFNGRTDTLQWLRAQIERIHSTPSQFQRITIGMQVLQGREDRLLRYCNVHDESMLYISDTRSITIFVDTPENGRLNINVVPSLKVSVLKKRIGCLTRTDPDNLWVTCGISLMQSGRLLMDYNLQHEGIVKMHPLIPRRESN